MFVMYRRLAGRPALKVRQIRYASQSSGASQRPGSPKSLQVDINTRLKQAARFPQPDHVLPRSDPWTMPGLDLSKPLPLALPEFTLALTDKNPEKAWVSLVEGLERQPDILARLDRSHLSKLLSLLPSGASNAKVYSPHAQLLKKRMQETDLDLLAGDYAALINLAFKAHDYDAVTALWIEMDHLRIDRDVVVWNQYIQATCDAYPLFWPKSIKPEKWSRLKVADLPPKINSVQDMLIKMEIDGVVPDARTYELVLLSLARDGKMDSCDQILEMTWLAEHAPSRNSVLWPSLSTLTSIVDAYGFNKQVERACELVDKMRQRYRLPLGAGDAINTWERLLRWTRMNTEPRGSLDTEFLPQLWTAMVGKYGVRPNAGLWSIYVEYLDWKNQFDTMGEAIGPILVTGDPQSRAVAASTLTRAVQGLVNTGRPLVATELVEKWARHGLNMRQELEEFVRKKGVTKEQMDMFNEDDDEDSILGI